MEFWEWISLAPDLYCVTNPIPYLQIFVEQVCMEILVAGGADV